MKSLFFALVAAVSIGAFACGEDTNKTDGPIVPSDTIVETIASDIIVADAAVVDTTAAIDVAVVVDKGNVE